METSDTKLKQDYYIINTKWVREPNIALGCTNYLQLGREIEYPTLKYQGIDYKFAGSTVCEEGFAFILEYTREYT